MKAKLLLIILLFTVILQRSTAQIIPPERDTIPPVQNIDLNTEDTLLTNNPTRDSTTLQSNNQKIKYSKDSLDAEINYDARDSMILDIKNQKVHLYGNAVVTYTTMELNADYIVFDWGNNIVEAEGLPDSLGNISGNPVFKETDQTFNAKRIRYNFKTKKGLVYEATTQEKDLYVLGKVGKMHSKNESLGETDDYIFSENAIFTTCDHPDPHFGIRSKKQKVIPGKIVVVGPSNLEVGGVPTPLWLPFGFFPLKKGDRTGLIFPRDYEFSDAWGFGLRNLGWYFPINDYMDLTVTGDIYTRGSWGLKLNSKYKKNYKFGGNLTLGYSNRKSEDRGVPVSNKSFSVQWSHTQDPKAHPLNRFSGSVNIQSNNYQSLNQNDFNSKYQNTFTSNVNYSRLFPDKPFTFSASMSHSQNTQTRKIDINLPTVDFQLTRIYPFKRKEGVGKDKWYEKISLQYAANARNRFTATDTTLFSQQTLDDAQFGIKHSANTNASFQFLKFFNVTPGVNYKEIWYFDHIQKELDPTLVFDTTFVESSPGEITMVIDTVSFGTIEEFKVRGFKPLRLFNANISVSTQIFGVRKFSKGKIRGIRHVLKPSASFGYTPDYTDPSFGYFDYVDTDTRPEYNDPQRYDIFEDGIYDRTPTGGKAMSLSYSLNNIFEAKVWSKRDSTEKNIKIFDNFRISGDYNFAADSFQLSRVRMDGTTRLFNGITTLSLNISFDPYAYDVEDGRRINKFYWDTNHKILRFESASLRFNTGLTIGKIKGIFTGEDKTGNKKSAPALLSNESLLDIFSGFRISHQLAFSGFSQPNGRDTFLVSTNSISMNGSIKLTEKWSLRVGNISYDFKLKRLVYPDIGFYRNLHCWELGVDWQPVNGTYSFYLRVKPGTLDFIKVPYQRGNQDAFGGF